jgi:hypothetical protein
MSALIATNNRDPAKSLMDSGFQGVFPFFQPQDREERHEREITSAWFEAYICNCAGSQG